KRETGLDAKVVVLDWGEAWSRISQALESGNGPDVLQLGTTWVSFFGSQGLLAPLNAHTNAINPDRFMATSWATTRVDGDTNFYAIPWFVDVRVLMANRRWALAAGVEPQDVATVDGFRQTLLKLRKANLVRDDATPVFPYAFPGKSDWNIPHNFAPWIWSQGGDFIGKENGIWRSRLLDKNTVIGIREYIGFVLDSLMNPGTLRENTAQVTGRFNNGEQIFSINTSEVIMQTRLPESEGGTMTSRIGQEGILTYPIPAGPGGSVAFVGGSNLALPRAKAKDASALKLLLFLTRPDNLDLYTRKIGFLPPDRGVLQIWAQDSLYRTLVDQAESGRAYPNIPSWGTIESMLVEMFSAIWTLLDAGGIYTDEDLYHILVQYNSKVNQALQAPAEPPPSLESFQEAIREITPIQGLDADSASNSRASQSSAPSASHTYLYTGIGLVFSLVVLAFVFVRRRSS
ncbi:MAG TPA: extracellular solute-binding protein, partial [Fibrobacteraceae bacterium]|nr:extracellular solute-binding protein [Fibrobacteraceae bacterium]